MAVILVIDALGTRAQWKEGGAKAASDHYSRFRNMITEVLRSSTDLTFDGITLESDTLVCEFQSSAAALQFAQRLFRLSFEKNKQRNRVWMRGVLVNRGTGRKEIRTQEKRAKYGANAVELQEFTYNRPFMKAIQAERSGFKGLRLLVEADCMDDNTRKQFTWNFNGKTVEQVRRLEHSFYPKSLGPSFQDFVWFARSGPDDFDEDLIRWTTFLRWAGADASELEQVAATVVAAFEMRALLTRVLK